ncbi:MAG: hypothetical protein QF886_16155, partial [Planctomycetota bacterium]|nr:hypothetical protein [Planctomycetota bacterium]
SWYHVSYPIRYWQPFLKAVKEKGLRIFVHHQESQPMPAGSVLAIEKETAKPMKLRFTPVVRSGSLPVSIAAADGKIIWQKTLTKQGTKPGSFSKVVPAASKPGIYQLTAESRSYYAELHLPATESKEMCVIKRGASVQVMGNANYIWYFKSAKGQRKLDWNWRVSPLKLGTLQVRSGDGRQVLLSMIASGDIKLNVQPETIHYLTITLDGSSAATLTPRQARLHLARTPEDLFDVE